MKLFIFGATGDLVKRKVVPALVSMGRNDIEIVALGRKTLTSEEYQSFVCDDCFAHFDKKPEYEHVNFEGSLTCDECEKHLERGETTYFYSALPPGQIEMVL